MLNFKSDSAESAQYTHSLYRDIDQLLQWVEKHTHIYAITENRWISLSFHVHMMVYHLSCPHPNCPIIFKSQHGQMYHIRTVHSWSLGHPINVRHGQVLDDLDHDYQDQEYEGHHLDGSESDNAHSVCARSPIPSDNNLNLNWIGQRIAHTHLAGMCMPLYYYTIVHV